MTYYFPDAEEFILGQSKTLKFSQADAGVTISHDNARVTADPPSTWLKCYVADTVMSEGQHAVEFKIESEERRRKSLVRGRDLQFV